MFQELFTALRPLKQDRHRCWPLNASFSSLLCQDSSTVGSRTLVRHAMHTREPYGL